MHKKRGHASTSRDIAFVKTRIDAALKLPALKRLLTRVRRRYTSYRSLTPGDCRRVKTPFWLHEVPDVSGLIE